MAPPLGRHFAGIDRTIRDDALDRGTDLGVGDLDGGAVVVSFGGVGLGLGAADLFPFRHLIQRLQVPLGGIELAWAWTMATLASSASFWARAPCFTSSTRLFVEGFGGFERLTRAIDVRPGLWSDLRNGAR